MDITATLKLDCGPFADALASAMAAVEQLAGESAGLAAAVAEAKANLDGLASGADAAADAHGDAARAAGEHAEAESGLGESAGEAAGKLDALKGGMAAAGTVEAVLSGNAKAAAGGVMQLSREFEALGVSMNAVLALGIVALIAAVAKAVADVAARQRQMRLDNAFDNAAASARTLAEAVSRVNAEMDRETALARELRGIESGRGDTRGRIALADNERARQEALRGASADDAARINAEYDLKRNAIVRDNAVRDAGGEEAAARKRENLAAIDEAKAQIAELSGQAAAAVQKAQAAAEVVNSSTGNGVQAFFNKNTVESARNDQDRYNALAAELAGKMRELSDRIKSYEDANVKLDATISASADKVALADAERAAADAAVATSLADAEKEASGTSSAAAGAADGSAGRMSGDRLARIGGFVGGAAPMRKTEDLLREANAQRGELLAAVRTGAGATFA